MPERVIGPFTFPTRKEAETRIREILHGSELDQPLVGDEFVLIRSLLDLHHEAEDKIGAGVRTITVKIIEFGARGFWVTRVDGTCIDFSYRTALNGAPTPKANVQAALRWEIQDQIERFRDEQFVWKDGPVICPLTGQELDRATSQVDHIEPFADLAQRFVTLVGGWSALKVECVGETGCRRQLAERELADVWSRFHQSAAQLRIVHKSANLARYRRGAA